MSCKITKNITIIAWYKSLLDADLINFKSERIPKTKIKRKNKIKLKLFSSKKNRKEKKTKIPPVRGTLFFDAYF